MTTDIDPRTLSTSDLHAAIRRLTALKAWGSRYAELLAESHRRAPIDLAQDSYYYGTAADFGTRA